MATLGKDRPILPLGKVDLSKWIHNGRSIQFTAVRSAPDRSDDGFYFPARTASPGGTGHPPQPPPRGQSDLRHR